MKMFYSKSQTLKRSSRGEQTEEEEEKDEEKKVHTYTKHTKMISNFWKSNGIEKDGERTRKKAGMSARDGGSDGKVSSAYVHQNTQK